MSLALRAYEQFLAGQRVWADRCGLETDGDAALARWEDALLSPLDTEAQARLERHPARPFGEAGKPAPLARLDSTWGLFCNVLTAVGEAALGRALGLAVEPARVAWMHPAADHAGVAATPPVLELADASDRPLFVEAHGPSLLAADPVSPRVLAQPGAGWGDLAGCRSFAIEAARGAEAGVALDAAPFPAVATLARIRTLTRLHGRRGFRYVVLAPDVAGPVGDALRRQLAGLRMRIAGEVDFDALGWRALVGRLRTGEAVSARLDAIADRYELG